MATTTDTWRSETPGHEGWERTARPGDSSKYFIVSADNHINEPREWLDRLDPKLRERLPPANMGTDLFRKTRYEGEDLERHRAARSPEQRVRDQTRDGVDAEILFPNRGWLGLKVDDAELGIAVCRVWNDWARETFADYWDRMMPMAVVPTIDVRTAVDELYRVAGMGFKGVTLPCKPVFGPPDRDDPNYNQAQYDPLWSVVQEIELPVTFHVSTGRDPRASRGEGGAVINYVVHSCAPSVEPIAALCASGVIERYPGVRFATIEAGIGWVAWALAAMDDIYHKHHMWVRPKLKELPSTYFRQNGFASFMEDPAGLALAERFDLVDCFMWSNDYPHHEGTWPHSAEAIERTMGGLTDTQRAKVLGLNAARFLNLDT